MTRDAHDKDMHKNRPLVGAEPGTLSLPEGSPSPRITLHVYGDESYLSREIESPGEISRWLAGSETVWVDVQGLGDEATLWELSEVFSIHPLAIEDIVHVPQRPKTQAYDNHQLLFTRMLTGGREGNIGLEQVSFVIGPSYVVTFQEREGDVFDPIRRRLASDKKTLRTKGADHLAYALLDTIVDAYFPVIESLGDCIADLEDEVFAGKGDGTLHALSEIRSTLLMVRRSIWPLRDTVNQLVRDDVECFGPEVRVFLRDVYDHCINASEMVETYRELGAGLMNSYLSVVSNRMNEIMKVLTVMSTIFIPLTFLSGLYGMNFVWMPERDWKWSYPILLGVMVTISVGLLIFFKRRGWFRKR
ncbi:MAG: magnesium/cobalt transporter CorA [Myxococcales bacterium]|nr:magnesium/cobalt transporter CorA [Myxococcales bacterium]